MPDSLLILVPLLALPVVLLLGFAGCRTIIGIEDPELLKTLSFRASVPTSLTVVSPPGVRFRWTRPGATMEEAADVAGSVQEGVDNVFEHEISGVEVGTWFGRCEMTVREGNRPPLSGASVAFMFEVESEFHENVLSFETTGSPSAPPFRVVVVGFSQS